MIVVHHTWEGSAVISIRGYYDGNTVVPLEEVRVKPNTKAIITFLEEEAGSVSDRTKELLRLSGTWADERSAEEIVQDIYITRSASERAVDL
jgi:hypothetical protein